MTGQPRPDGPILPEALRYYEEYDEAGRLFRRAGQIERLGTQELIVRYAITRSRLHP